MDASGFNTLTEKHLNPASRYLVSTSTTSSANLGRELKSLQTPRKRKRSSETASKRVNAATKPPAGDETSPKLCTHCSALLVPGSTVVTRLESVTTSAETRKHKLDAQSEVPRKSKRRKEAWGPKKSSEPVKGSEVKGREGKSNNVWFSTRELRQEFGIAEKEGENWAVKAREAMERWDMMCSQGEQSKVKSNETEDKLGRRKRKGPEQPAKNDKKRLLLKCTHCQCEMRIPLEHPSCSKPAGSKSNDETTAQKRATASATAKKPQAAQKPDPKTQSTAAKAKARAKLRKQGLAAGLMARREEDKEKKGSGLGLMDLMKSV